MKQEQAVKEQEQSEYKTELLEKCDTSNKDIFTWKYFTSIHISVESCGRMCSMKMRSKKEEDIKQEKTQTPTQENIKTSFRMTIEPQAVRDQVR